MAMTEDAALQKKMALQRVASYQYNGSTINDL